MLVADSWQLPDPISAVAIQQVEYFRVVESPSQISNRIRNDFAYWSEFEQNPIGHPLRVRFHAESMQISFPEVVEIALQ